MKAYLIALSLVLSSLSLFGLNLRLNSGLVYTNASVKRVEPDGVTILHSIGIAKVKFSQLPAEIQKQYGYDEAKAKQYQEETSRKVQAARHEKTRLDSQQHIETSNESVPTSDSNAQCSNRGLCFWQTLFYTAVIALILLIVSSPLIRFLRKRRMISEVKSFISQINREKRLLPVNAELLLKKDESAYLIERCVLSESRSVRQSQGGFMGFRLAKGVYIGGSSSSSRGVPTLVKIDNGTLTLTNKKLVFDGSKEDRQINLERILSVGTYLNSLELTIENKQKSLHFSVDNSFLWAAYIKLLCQVSDPADLSGRNVNLTFD